MKKQIIAMGGRAAAHSRGLAAQRWDCDREGAQWRHLPDLQSFSRLGIM